MSLGANLSSGYTDTVRDTTVRCSLTVPNVSNICPSELSGNSSKIYPVAAYSSMRLQAKCPRPLTTPAEAALYPKVTVPSSVRTESLAKSIENTPRFSQYVRYQPPVPCLPLPQSANMAGKSLPSSRACNL
jgi:hypothetical protein